jgi:hypothetical protein
MRQVDLVLQLLSTFLSPFFGLKFLFDYGFWFGRDTAACVSHEGNRRENRIVEKNSTREAINCIVYNKQVGFRI